MDSINRNQPEENHEDLQGSSARKKIKELAEKRQVVSFVQLWRLTNHLQQGQWLFRK